MKYQDLFLTDAQLANELSRCEFCEEKPCLAACPVDCSPADFIMSARLLNTEDIGRAAAEIMTRNPLGGVCGATCPDTHCQSACTHKLFDRAIQIPRVQATLVQRAKELGVMPTLAEPEKIQEKKVAILGGGPAGLVAARTLAQMGFACTLFERDETLGGALKLIPEHRLPQGVLESDIEWLLDTDLIEVKTQSAVADPKALLGQGFDAVVVGGGLHDPITLPIPGAEAALTGNKFLANPGALSGKVAVIGGGAIAVDCATAALSAGADSVEMFTLEKWSELPLTADERRHILEHGVEISGRIRVAKILLDGDKVTGIETVRVELPAGEEFHPAKMQDLAGSEQRLAAFTEVIFAIGNRPEIKATEIEGVFWAGDGANGPSTVVEAAASGKNAAAQVAAYLTGKAVPSFEKATKSHVVLEGYNELPVSLETDFFGRKLRSPFILSAAPPTDGYDQMRVALEAGWAGGIMKTAFDGGDIHIPADYMFTFGKDTYANCDNVSEHPLDLVCAEIKKLRQEFPDRLIAASTGGPVSGDDEADKKGWQANMRKLEEAGAMAVEFSLSCPQGGDGTEGDIVAQSPTLTAKIIDWLLETSDPEIPKLFKLTGAVTSINAILAAIKPVLEKYPNKKAGVTLANTFPSMTFRESPVESKWDQGVVVGLSGYGVTAISNLSLANASSMDIAISGNGGPMDYRAAADFLALGAKNVQFCTIAMKYGVNIIHELETGLSHMMAARGIASIDELTGIALPKPITDFMELSPERRIPQLDPELCTHCGNCTRCSYHAVSLDENKLPVFDPSKCVGCSICTKKCFTEAIKMRPRTEEERAQETDYARVDLLV